MVGVAICTVDAALAWYNRHNDTALVCGSLSGGGKTERDEASEGREQAGLVQRNRTSILT